jgi:hypothetical protein
MDMTATEYGALWQIDFGYFFEFIPMSNDEAGPWLV